MISAMVPESFNEDARASPTAFFNRGTFDQSVAVSRVSHNAPASSSESRSTGALNRPCSQCRAGSSPTLRAPIDSSRSRVSLWRDAVCSGVPSYMVMHMQPGGDFVSPALSPDDRFTEDSISSDSRITVGPVPVCVTARRAATPVGKSLKVKAS